MSGRSRGIALAAVFAALAFAAPAAQATPVGGFAGGDGTQTGGNCSTALDWSCLSPSQITATIDPGAATDEVFSGSNKEDTPDQWLIATGPVGTAKADVLANWSYSFSNSPINDTNYLALAFNRANGSGNTYVAFELNQSAQKYFNNAGSSIVCRTNGDIVLSFEIQPNNSTVALNIYKWTWNTGGSYPAPCTAGASGTFSAPVTLPTSAAQLAINTAPITNYLSTGALGTSFDTATFGEAAVDLTALANAVAPAATCEFFNHLQITTRSSSSTTSSNLEDYVDAGPIAARACKSSGGGGGLTLPNVAITSPADNSVDTTSTIVLTGTSDQPEVEVLDGTTVVGNAPVSGGTWSLTLNGVADGLHTYSAVATNSAGTTTSNVVHVTVQTSASNGGGGPTTTTAGSMSATGTGAGAGGIKGAGPGKNKKRKLAVCSSKRKFTIRIRTHHAHLVSATITVNGKLVKTLHGKRITAPVDLRGLPRGGFTVRIRVRAADGRVFTGKRVYHTCTPRKSKKTIPVL